MNFEQPRKEKTKGFDNLIQDLNARESQLNEKRKKKWITEDEYKTEMEHLEEERLELETRPD
jgi:hypothetical protein